MILKLFPGTPLRIEWGDAAKPEITKNDPQKKSAPKPEKSGACELVLNDVGKNKFAVVKLVMEITELELKDAKELVDNLPFSLKKGLKKEAAQALLKKIESAGGTAEIVE